VTVGVLFLFQKIIQKNIQDIDPRSGVVFFCMGVGLYLFSMEEVWMGSACG
jgi:hypothetical protein